MKRICLVLAVILLFSSVGLAEKWECPDCGQQNEYDFCEKCGVAKSSWVCPNCRKTNTMNFIVTNNINNNGGLTQDYVYVLSADEASKYFSSDAARVAEATPRARKNGVDDWSKWGARECLLLVVAG